VTPRAEHTAYAWHADRSVKTAKSEDKIFERLNGLKIDSGRCGGFEETWEMSKAYPYTGKKECVDAMKRRSRPDTRGGLK
jgi:hypothetical protein